ncbi:DUF1284 domain-containing protein [Roseobacteraceae bacterium S113]
MLRFRPHHFFCALGFQGKGYSSRFTANMSAIVNGRLRGPDGDGIRIVVTGKTDAICSPCPKRIGTRCLNEAKIQALDTRHAEALGLSPGDALTWAEAKARMAAQPEGTLERICEGCQWLPLGLCSAAHAALRDEKRAG